MAPSFRRALGAMKDRTSISLVKVSGSMDPELDAAVIKATSHDDKPANERYLSLILTLTSYSKIYVSACIAAVSKRLDKTHDWVVALKILMLIHRLLVDGDPAFQHDILHATRRGTRLLNMADFYDKAHSDSWNHSIFNRAYAFYLDQCLKCSMYQKKKSGVGSNHPIGLTITDRWKSLPASRQEYGDHDSHVNESRSSYSPSSSYGKAGDDEHHRWIHKKSVISLRDMKQENVLGRMQELQQLLDRFLACRPTGRAENCKLILTALCPIVRESFQLYVDICEILAILLDRFFDMDYSDCVKSFAVYASAAKQIDELNAFYAWFKRRGVARPLEYPEVQRITAKLLQTLEDFMKDNARRPKSPLREALPVATLAINEEADQDLDNIKTLTAPSNCKEKEPKSPKVTVEEVIRRQQQRQQLDLIDICDDGMLIDDQSNKFAIALFKGSMVGNSWKETFPSSMGGSGATSAWQSPIAEIKTTNRETMLMETTSNLSNQKNTSDGEFSPLLLNGMHDQGNMKHQMKAQVSGGSPNNMALPRVLGRGDAPVLALPASENTMQMIGQNPFVSSPVSIPSPSYAQMAEIENKQQMLIHEHIVWRQYANSGMQAQPSLAKLNNNNNNNSSSSNNGSRPFMPNSPLPTGMPTSYSTDAYYYHAY